MQPLRRYNKYKNSLNFKSYHVMSYWEKIIIILQIQEAKVDLPYLLTLKYTDLEVRLLGGIKIYIYVKNKTVTKYLKNGKTSLTI